MLPVIIQKFSQSKHNYAELLDREGTHSPDPFSKNFIAFHRLIHPVYLVIVYSDWKDKPLFLLKQVKFAHFYLYYRIVRIGPDVGQCMVEFTNDG